MTAVECYETVLAAIVATAVEQVTDDDVLVHYPYLTDETPERDRQFTLRAKAIGINFDQSCERRIIQFELIVLYSIHERYQQRMLADADALLSTIRDLEDGVDIVGVDPVDNNMDDILGVALHERIFDVMYNPSS